MKLIVEGIEVPIEVEDYITPDLRKAFDYYPQWLAEYQQLGVPSFQCYALLVCAALEEANARPGRTCEEYFKRFLEHEGVTAFATYCEQYKRRT